MATEAQATDTKQRIVEAFQQLLEEREGLPPEIGTKEEAAERERDRQVVETASTYTVESVVKSLADLQLYFGGDIDELTEKLNAQIRQLEETRRAIEVETKHLEELRHIRTAVQALDILEREHQSEAQALEEEAKRQRDALDREIAEKRQEWQKEQEEHDLAVKAYEDALQRERGQEEENHQYEVERERKIEADAYEEKKRTQEIELAQTAAEKERDWGQREAILAERQQRLEEYKARTEAFPQELEAAVKQAREEATRTAQQTAQVEADLFEKEIEVNRKVHEANIQELKERIQEQREQVEALSSDLGSALKQVQVLTEKALEGPSGVRAASD